MSSHSSFSILFWIKKNKLKNGKAPLYARITIHGQRAELAVQREISPSIWDPNAQRVNVKTSEAKEINNHLALINAKLLSCHSKLEARNAPISAESLKIEYLGKVEKAEDVDGNNSAT
jgi:hypothetical protein